jgi:hypothetical protein
MSLEAQNRELQMFLEPQKQRNKVENAGKERNILSQILSPDPFYFQELYLAHFSFILNNFKGYKCVISKCIKLV